MSSPPPVELRKYERVFVLYLLGGTLVLVLVRTFTEMSATGVSLLLPALAMWAAIGKFAEDHARLPDDVERRRLMKVGMGVTTLLLLVGVVAIGLAAEVGVVLLAALLAIGLLFNWAALRTGFWMSRILPVGARTPRR